MNAMTRKDFIGKDFNGTLRQLADYSSDLKSLLGL